MGGKIVVSVISIILVVGVVIGVVAVVHRSGVKGSNNNKDENISSSMKTVNALCAPATYKDACINSLGSVLQNESAIPQDYVKAGVKLALEQVTKAANLTDTFIPKANDTKNPDRTNMAINSCQDLFNLAIDRLDGALVNVSQHDVYKDKGQVWNIRLWLTDVITFATNCVDEFEEAEAADLKKLMQDGVLNATEITTNMLDIVTIFNEALGEMGQSLNATKLAGLATESADAATGSGRRLLGMTVDGEGYPTWLSIADRKLLGGKGLYKKISKGKSAPRVEPAGRSNNNNNKNPVSSMEIVNALCAPATYKDACIKNLGLVAQKKNASPQDYVKAGVKLALEEITKAANLTDTFIPKAKDTKNVKRTHMALDSCKDQFKLAVDRLDGVIADVSKPDVYKDKAQVLNIRLLLSDVITAATSCVDEFNEAEAPDLQKMMQDGVLNARELTTDMLDIVTIFNEAFCEVGNSFNVTKLVELAAMNPAVDATSSGRRLLSVAVDSEGYPTRLLDTDRRLLGAKGLRKRINKGKGKGMKKAFGKGKKKGLRQRKHAGRVRGAVRGAVVGAGAAAVAGAVAAVGPGPGVRPNAVVAQDGSGQFRTIMDALRGHPGKNARGRWVIYVKAGIYKEDVVVGKEHPNIFMYGDGPTRTVITGSKSFHSGFQTSKTAPFNVEGINFFARDMGFQNTAGPVGHQAVALRVNALQAIFHNCWFDGFQDTLYVQGGSQFFRDCQIAGTVDFIFGNGATLIQNCKILAKKGGQGQQNMVTAQGGVAANEPTGIVIQGCEILPDRDLFPVRFQFKTYLGRPWKAYAKTVFMESLMADLIQPDGYFPWAGSQNLATAFYGEYANRGPGANTARRVKWKNVRVLNKVEAQRYSAGLFLGGAPWVKTVNVPLNLNVV